MPRRPVHVPLWGVVVICLAAFVGPILSITASTRIARHNSETLIQQYRIDQARQTEQTRQLSCALFGSQLDAFESAESETGRASYRAWLDLYRLAKCQPERR